MAEPGHPASRSSSSSPSSPSEPSPPGTARDAIPEEQLGPAAAPADDLATIALPADSGGGAPSVPAALSPANVDQGRAADLCHDGPSCDPFLDSSPTPNVAADPSSVAGQLGPTGGTTSLGLGPADGAGAVLPPGPIASLSPAPPFVTPPPPPAAPASACSQPQSPAPLPGSGPSGSGTAQVSVIAADSHSPGSVLAGVAISLGRSQAEVSQASGAAFPGTREKGPHLVSHPSGARASSASVAWADEQVVLSEKQKGKLPALSPEPDDGGVPRPLRPAAAIPTQEWRKSSDRPPQKLPIRFKDAMGRNHLWPWKVAKTWKGAKRLIDAAFRHVHIIGEHVVAGHYDLFIHHAWEEPQPESRQGKLIMSESGQASTSYSAVAPPQKEDHASAVVAPIVVVDQEPAEPGAHVTTDADTSTGPGQVSEDVPPGDTSTPSWSPTNSSAPSFVTASPPPSPPLPPGSLAFPPPPPPPPPPASGNGPPGFLDLNLHGVFLLPELWDEVVEPGMYISMHIWPFPNNPVTTHPLAPPLSPPPMPPGWSTGRGGRGRGRGRGGQGRGGVPLMPPNPMPPSTMPPPPPPGWPQRRLPITIEIPIPRPKTRKRQDGL